MNVDAALRRRRAWPIGAWPIGVAIAAWGGAVAWPATALVMQLSRSTLDAGIGGAARMHSLPRLAVISIGWAVLVAICSALLGWLPGRWLGSLTVRRGSVIAAAAVIIPMCMPAYLVFYAWWQSWPAGTPLHRWVIEHGAMQLARDGTLLLGLVCWSWPIVALCVAGAAARRSSVRDEMLAIDAVPRPMRMMDQLRTDAPGLAVGMLLVALATLSNTTCFDLAEVYTFANEARARAAVTPGLATNPGPLLAMSWPVVVLALGGGLLAWRCIGSSSSDSVMWRPIRRQGLALVITIWCLTVLLPLTMLGFGVARFGGVARAVREFVTLYTGNVTFTLVLAACSGCLAAVIALGMIMLWSSDKRAARRLATMIGVSWLVWSLLPGTILGVSLQAAWNRGALVDLVFRSPMVLIVAHLSAWGFIAPLLARWLTQSEAPALRDLRRVDGVESIRGVVVCMRPAVVAVCVAAWALVTALAVGEIVVTAVIVPPLPINRTPLAMTLLNDMHYQRPQTVLVGALLMLVLGLIAALVSAVAWRLMWTRVAVPPAAAVLLAVSLTGCAHEGDGPQPLDVEFVFGSPGQAPGQFGYPRCIDADSVRGCVYVIDKTARVQRFDLEGTPQASWRMPEWEQGKPTGVSVAPNGHVFVPDTHYFRVIEYDADGHEIRRFGSYGEGPGQFIYVTDVAVASNGNLYVAEYGGNDRVQVFSPAGEYLFDFGEFGRGPGQFSRPQGLAFNADGTELFITDACNHRIVVTDLQGRWLRTFGEAGREPGQLAYPYGLVMLPDNSVLVAEFGNNRVQRFDTNGRSLGVFGTVGRGKGELQYPWAVAATDDRIFVLDSGNNRVQVMDLF